MKAYLLLLAVDFRRAVISVRFVLCTLGVTCVILFTSLGDLYHGNAQNVISLIHRTGINQGMALVLGILPLFPFAVSFATEWEEHSARFWIIRTGVRNYSICKVITSIVSGILTTALGMALTLPVMCLRYPLTSAQFGFEDGYTVFLKSGKPLLYLLVYIIHISLSSALFAAAALWISTYFPNKFVAIASPLVLFYMILRLTGTITNSSFLNINNIVLDAYNAGTPAISMLVKLLTVAVLCGLMGYGTVRRIKRRVQSE